MICNARFYVTAGGLMYYSTDLVDQSRLAASYLIAFSEAPVPPRFQRKHLVDT